MSPETPGCVTALPRGVKASVCMCVCVCVCVCVSVICDPSAYVAVNVAILLTKLKSYSGGYNTELGIKYDRV